MISFPSISELRGMDSSKRVPHLTTALYEAINALLKADAALFAIGVHEQTICHRLAIHLERLWDSLIPMNIDCEYNRDMAQYKEYDYQVWNRKRRFRPDIILHERLNTDYNMLAIESKAGATSAKVAKEDRDKIERVVTQTPYRYSLGAFLHFANQPKVTEPCVIVELFTEYGGWVKPQSVCSSFGDELTALSMSRKKS